MFVKGQIIQGRIEKLIFSGLGLLRHEEKVIFVEDVIQQEFCEVEIIDVKKNYALAKLKKVLEKSSLRISPRCPYFGICGGCQLQHIEYSEHLSLKAEWLRETLFRIGKITLECDIAKVPAHQTYEYRRRVLLHATIDKDEVHLGFTRKDLHGICDISLCPIFVKEENPVICDAKKILQKLCGIYFGSIDVHVLKVENNQYAYRFCFEKSFGPQIVRVIEVCRREFPFYMLFFQDPTKQIPAGSPYYHIELDGMKFYFALDAFIQNHSEQSIKLYQEIVRITKKESSHMPVLDLYCGIGITTLLIAKEGIQCLGIESVPSAIHCANKSKSENNISHCEFVIGKVEKKLLQLQNNTYGLVIVNPPRTGLSGAVLELLLRMKPKAIAYISCMPSTLARDLKEFCQKGYVIEHVSCYDMFCQTTHLESLIVLKKK